MLELARTILSGERTVNVSCSGQAITFEVEDREQLERLMGSYTNETLPMEFKVIFQNVQEIYFFVAEDSANKVRVENRAVVIMVQIIDRMKEFYLPLEEVELTGDMRLRREIKDLQERLQRKCRETEQMQETLREKESSIEEMKLASANLSTSLKDKESENLKLANRIRHLQNSLDDLKSSQNNAQQSRFTEEYSPVKKSSLSRSKKAKDLEQYGKKLVFKVDEQGKHYSKFRIHNNDVQKLHGPTYQLFHNQPIPREGKFYFDIKIMFIKNNNIVVGVITDKNKEEQFSFKRSNCICYNGYDGSVCEQDKTIYVGYKPKENNKIRTVVDISQSLVEFYLIGGDAPKESIGKAHIPPSMAKQPLYPYFELYWESNRVKLNA